MTKKKENLFQEALDRGKPRRTKAGETTSSDLQVVGVPLRMPRHLRTALRMQSVREERSMNEIVGELITNYLRDQDAL